MKSTNKNDVVAAGLPGDPIAFKAMTEIGIIAHLADNLFAKYLPDSLTIAQFGVLNHLLRLNRQETIGELASAMQVSQPTMSSTVRKLEDKGFIQLIANDDDRRVRRVSVTPNGRAIRNQSLAKILPIQESIAGDVTESEWESLLPVLTKIRIILDQNRHV
ncbi:MAG: hypothetical protein COA43_10275 [Robiginitomaculum sp.]|nr:MAG: hypothetical protein COA43_10275 [Robiginitomaculum sp.]